MQSPPLPRYLVPPRSKYSPQHPVLKHPQLPFLPQCQRPSFTPIQKTGKIILLAVKILNCSQELPSLFLSIVEAFDISCVVSFVSTSLDFRIQTSKTPSPLARIYTPLYHHHVPEVLGMFPVP